MTALGWAQLISLYARREQDVAAAAGDADGLAENDTAPENGTAPKNGTAPTLLSSPLFRLHHLYRHPWSCTRLSR